VPGWLKAVWKLFLGNVFLSLVLTQNSSRRFIFLGGPAPPVAPLEEQADDQEAEGEKAGKHGLYPVAVENGQDAVQPPAG
jgi:hypothetical protein